MLFQTKSYLSISGQSFIRELSFRTLFSLKCPIYELLFSVNKEVVQEQNTENNTHHFEIFFPEVQRVATSLTSQLPVATLKRPLVQSS